MFSSLFIRLNQLFLPLKILLTFDQKFSLLDALLLFHLFLLLQFFNKLSSEFLRNLPLLFKILQSFSLSSCLSSLLIKLKFQLHVSLLSFKLGFSLSKLLNSLSNSVSFILSDSLVELFSQVTNLILILFSRNSSSIRTHLN